MYSDAPAPDLDHLTEEIDPGGTRDAHIKVYVFQNEKTQIRQRAHAAGFTSASDYLRSGGKRGWLRRIDLILEFDRHLGVIEEAIRWTNATGAPHLAAPAQAAVDGLRDWSEQL